MRKRNFTLSVQLLPLELNWNMMGKHHYGKKDKLQDFPGGPVVKNPPANAGDMSSSPGPGRSHMPRST